MAEPSQPRPSHAQGPTVAPKTLESLFQAEKISMSKEKEHLFTHLSGNFDKKRLFVCCDGTQKNASGTVAPLTNVSKLSRAVSRYGRDPFSLPLIPEGQLDSATHDGAPRNADNWYGVVRQSVYYSGATGSQSPFAPCRWFAGMTGTRLISEILNAYCFLCHNYNFASQLDEIILVGSSHGAHTVRGLAKFLNDVGLLCGKGLAFLQPLYLLWKRNAGYKPRGFGNQDNSLPRTWVELDSMCKSLRESGVLFPVKIKVLAEWDPVSAGIGKGDLGFVRDIVPGNVEYAFLAYALHGKRAQFKPLLWAGPECYTTRVRQCAFNGTHSDITGGSSDCGLSTFALLWMASQIQVVSKAAFDSDTLLEFVTPLQAEQHWWQRGFGQWRNHDLLYTKCRRNESSKEHSKLLHRLNLSLWGGTRYPLSETAKKHNFEMTLHPSVYFINNENYFDDSSSRHKGVSAISMMRDLRYVQVNTHERTYLEIWKVRIRNTMLADFPGQYIVFDARDNSVDDPQGWKRGILSGSKPWSKLNRGSLWARDMAKGPLIEPQEPLQDLQGMRRLLLDLLTSRFVEVDQTTAATKPSKTAPVAPAKARQPLAGDSKGKQTDGDSRGKAKKKKNSEDNRSIAGSVSSSSVESIVNWGNCGSGRKEESSESSDSSDSSDSD